MAAMDRAQVEEEFKSTLVKLQERAGTPLETALALQEVLRLTFRQAVQIANHDFNNIVHKKLVLWNKQLKKVLGIN